MEENEDPNSLFNDKKFLEWFMSPQDAKEEQKYLHFLRKQSHYLKNNPVYQRKVRQSIKTAFEYIFALPGEIPGIRTRNNKIPWSYGVYNNSNKHVSLCKSCNKCIKCKPADNCQSEEHKKYYEKYLEKQRMRKFKN